MSDSTEYPGTIDPELGLTLERDDGQKLEVQDMAISYLVAPPEAVKIRCRKWQRERIAGAPLFTSALRPLGVVMMTRPEWDAWIRGAEGS